MLDGWNTIGSANWEAQQGRITGMPEEGDGWLVLDKGYQDMQFSTRFRCQGTCDTGVLFRMTDAGNGEHQGIFIALTDSLRSYRVRIKEGTIVHRLPLMPAAAMIRIAPPPDQQGTHQTPTARPLPIQENKWHVLEIALDVNIIRVRIDDWGFAGHDARTGDTGDGYGPIALYAGGSDRVQFENMATMDYNTRYIAPEKMADNFTKQRLDEFYYAWDTAIADINQDGTQDVVAGPYYYLGPDYTTRREIYIGQTYNPSTEYALNMITHAADFTGDGWPDVLATDMRPMMLLVNPQGEARRWDKYEVLPNVISETTILHDIDNDGQPEVVYGLNAQGLIGYAEPDPANPTAPWIEHRISEPLGRGNIIHGLGVGDINGDGRPDILVPTGWLEQPKQDITKTTWTFHPVAFATAGPIKGAGGSKMSVADLNGDGLNDVAASLNAHGWGMAWFEQKRTASGEITFEPHLIMGDMTWDNPDGVIFSQLHGGVELADIDRDGVLDLVTGKRYWSHLDNTTDPNPWGEAVLYWFRTVNNAEAPGGIAFKPELIHNRSGVGSQFEVRDLNQDGSVDIITSGDRGTFIFWGK